MSFEMEKTAATRQETGNSPALGEKELRVIADHSPVWISFIDAQERFGYVNGTCAAWLAQPAADILHKRIEEISPESYGDLKPLIDEALAGREVTFERKVSYPDGVRRHVSIHFLPQRHDLRQVTGFFAYVVDLTRQEAAEVRITALERMEALGALAGGIAHDFNNLLTPIIGFLELSLNELPKETSLHHNLMQIRQAAYRGKALVSEILQYSREPSCRPDTISLTPVLEEVVQLVRTTVPHRILVRTQLDSAPVTVRADASQLHRLLMNLCRNAVDAMPRGGVLSLTLDTMVADGLECYAGHSISGPFLRIGVSDTGKGMDPCTLERIFEPFFTTKPAREGTGLGLATVFEVVRNHDGHLRIASKPGKGTTFEVFLPIPDHALASATPTTLTA